MSLAENITPHEHEERTQYLTDELTGSIENLIEVLNYETELLLQKNNL